MNPAHFHLLVNHFPIIGMILAIPVMIVAKLKIGGRGATLAAIIIILIASLASITSVISGEDAHEYLDNLPGLNHEVIEQHEERAEIANVFAIVTGVSALLLLLLGMRSTKPAPSWIWTVTFVLVLITSGLMVWTGEEGGHIRHPETYSDYTPPPEGGGHSHELGEAGERAHGAFDQVKDILAAQGETVDQKLSALQESLEHAQGETRAMMKEIDEAAKKAGDRSAELLAAVQDAIDKAEASGEDIGDAVHRAIERFENE